MTSIDETDALAMLPEVRDVFASVAPEATALPLPQRSEIDVEPPGPSPRRPRRPRA